MKQYHAPVLSNIQVSERYWHMTVDSSALPFKPDPGQFFHIRCAGTYSPFLRRPLSIYQIHEHTLEFLYVVKGKGTTAMTRIRKGDTLDMMGPVGKGFELYKQAETVLLIARGVGIATLAAVAQAAFQQKAHCVAVLSARTEEDLLAAEYLEEFGATVYKVTDEGGTSDVNHVKQLIQEDILPRYKIDSLYTCGSRRLSKLAQSIAFDHQIPGEIALEEHMGCAMGACFACVCDIQEGRERKSVRVCMEGPVFPLEKVVME